MDMDKDTQAELDRLEREIWSDNKDLTDIMEDDVLTELDEILEQEPAPAEDQTPAAPTFVPEEDDEDEDLYEDEEDFQDEGGKDGLTIGLLITASALCVGIIGVLIYWLENFL